MRIAKYISARGFCSRRDAETLIKQGRVALNGIIISSPVTFVTEQDEITIDNKRLAAKTAPRMWKYYKPVGLITTHYDPQGRPTVFDHLPPILNGIRVISVGRLDLNSEGLLLLTDSPQLAHYFEQPSNNFQRVYKVRVYGSTNLLLVQHRLKKGITIDGISYLPIDVKYLNSSGVNQWLEVVLHEGKNREIRRVFEYFGFSVNRLIRVHFGPFSLDKLEPGQAEQLAPQQLLFHNPSMSFT